MSRKLAFLVAASLAAAPASADAAASRLTVEAQQRSGSAHHPVSFFDVPVAPAERSRIGQVRISNRASKRVTVKIAPVDATTAANLGFAYDVAGLSAHGPTRWVRPSAETVTIRPRSAAVVRVAVAAPAELEPGDYLAGVSIEAVGQRETPSGRQSVAVSSSQRFVVGVLMRAPGPRRAHLSLTGASVKREPAGVSFLLNARNDGNVMLTGVTGRVEVTREGEGVVAQARLGPGTFVTGTSMTYPLLARAEHPRPGTRYRVRATLRYAGRTAKLDKTVTFGRRAAERDGTFTGSAPPDDRATAALPAWVFALLALGILAAAIAVARRWRRRTAGPDLPAVEHVIERLREQGVELHARPDGTVDLIEIDPTPAATDRADGTRIA